MKLSGDTFLRHSVVSVSVVTFTVRIRLSCCCGQAHCCRPCHTWV